MDDQDGIGIERQRVDPALMQKVLAEQEARKSKRKEWQRLCTVVPREWELRLLDAKRVIAALLLKLHAQLAAFNWSARQKEGRQFVIFLLLSVPRLLAPRNLR